MVKRGAVDIAPQDSDIDSEVEFSDNPDAESVSETESIEETAAGKRLRLAKQYLNKLENQEVREENDAEANREIIAHRLQQDVLAERGRLEERISKRLCILDTSRSQLRRGHRLSPTCVALTDTHIYSSSKDGAITKWCLVEGSGGKKVCTVRHPSGKAVFAITASTDNILLASGGEDKKVIVWDAVTMTPIKTFHKHRDVITSLVFRTNSHLLFSGARDRTINLWNCDEMVYIESLYGHQDHVTSLDSFLQERVVSVGGRDRSLRLWKVAEESQLVFNGHKNTVIDCVSMLNEEHFVTGSQDNVVAVWHLKKKKPVASHRNAHGPGSWVCSIVAFRNTECFVSGGSGGGLIKVWACAENYLSLSCLKEIPMVGTVNSLATLTNFPDISSANMRDKWKKKRMRRLKKKRKKMRARSK
eukprot:sb/3465090/